MMSVVVTVEIRFDVAFELLVVGPKRVTHIDNWVWLEFEPVAQLLVEARLALQICPHVRAAIGKYNQQFLASLFDELFGPGNDILGGEQRCGGMDLLDLLSSRGPSGIVLGNAETRG